MSLVFLSFLAGILTVLAPCAFMLLPIIIGGSVGNKSNLRPVIITASLAASLFLFTVVLKASSLLIDINPVFLNYFSGVIIILLGLISLFPETWDNISARFKLSNTSDELLNKATQKEGITGQILTGAALGPVFSACSPTYVFILTTVLRENISSGLLNIFAYILGLSSIMLLVGFLGQKFVRQMRWAVNPKGIFKRIVAVIFIIVGLLITFGFDKKLQASLVSFSPVAKLEQNLLNQTQDVKTSDSTELFNVNPKKAAPEIRGITEWINSNGETLEKNKGKVILIDFWTYSCVNCLRSAPYLNEWYKTYKDQGFVVIGLHAPEFAFEKKRENVEKAIQDSYKIEYPVGLDNDYETWDAYQNRFWPAKYLIDAEGNLRYTHFGEGEYDKTETAIVELLKEKGSKVEQKNVSKQVNTGMQAGQGQTQETFLGWALNDKYGQQFENLDELKGQEGKIQKYNLKSSLDSNKWSLGGSWLVNNESIIAQENGTKLVLKFSAKEVYIVAQSDVSAMMKVSLNGKSIANNQAGSDVQDGKIKIDSPKLYKLVKLDKFTKDQVLELEVEKGAQLNVFTFGS